ncbi:hypothetical protein LMG27177_01809 [Paraburkholderia fynbosensis]|uniref:Uncharacterized protein n=1 Tax=Paraburkholderia fynbosensis TaxID=1200993 RepID=A0A6J5FUW5_9BURK|nr:hypothetical protein LMG27177_01809 [Paraburkholderia fynbosensis]
MIDTGYVVGRGRSVTDYQTIAQARAGLNGNAHVAQADYCEPSPRDTRHENAAASPSRAFISVKVVLITPKASSVDDHEWLEA